VTVATVSEGDAPASLPQEAWQFAPCQFGSFSSCAGPIGRHWKPAGPSLLPWSMPRNGVYPRNLGAGHTMAVFFEAADVDPGASSGDTSDGPTGRGTRSQSRGAAPSCGGRWTSPSSTPNRRTAAARSRSRASSNFARFIRIGLNLHGAGFDAVLPVSWRYSRSASASAIAGHRVSLSNG
jgi:hypothetical protein